MKIELIKERVSLGEFKYWVMINDSYTGLTNCFYDKQLAINYMDSLIELHKYNKIPKLGKTVLKTITL